MFAKKLKQALKDLGIRQIDLAALLGVSPSVVTQYVNGYKAPSDKRKQEIIEVLGLPRDYFGEIEPEELVQPKPHGDIHRITLKELEDRTGISQEVIADIARERELPGLYACNQKKRTIYVINEAVFCRV